MNLFSLHDTLTLQSPERLFQYYPEHCISISVSEQKRGSLFCVQNTHLRFSRQKRPES